MRRKASSKDRQSRTPKEAVVRETLLLASISRLILPLLPPRFPARRLSFHRSLPAVRDVLPSLLQPHTKGLHPQDP